MLYFSQIGKALRRLRQRNNLRQSDLAEAAEVTAPMLSAYETGRQRPSFVTIDKILAAMGCDAMDLVAALLEVEQQGDRSEARWQPKAASSGFPAAEHRRPKRRSSSLVRGPTLGVDPVLSSMTEQELDYLKEMLPDLHNLLRRLKR